ncbi:MAG: GNAT family N-acetyltransferase [Tagaea sp.]
MSGIDIAVEAPDSPDARACLDAYFAELAARFEGGFDPGTKGYSDPKDAGEFFVARIGGKAIACGAVKRIDAGTAEIKRMWVSPEARGQGVAKALLAALEAEAAKRGAVRIVLDTNKALLEAHALYRKAGYREIARFNDNPYAHLWFEKRLSA